MLNLRRATLALILSAFVTLLTAPSFAQTWPQRPVHFIIPLGPGSGVDITARVFADNLSAKWGQPVVVENKPGGDAFVAITAVIGARRPRPSPRTRCCMTSCPIVPTTWCRLRA